MKTVGRWPWKPATAKDRVTAHRPNGSALKMDGAQAVYRYVAGSVNAKRCRVGGRDDRGEGWG